MSAYDHGSPHPSTGRHLVWALLLTLGFAVVEAAGGWWARSLALLSDAGHMVTDSTALGLAALASWVARRPPSERHSYGLGRAEVIAALVNALVMLGVVTGIVIAAIERLHTPQPVMGQMVIAIAGLGLVINLIVAWALSSGEQTLNTRAALLHVLGDLAGSAAALVAGMVIYFTAWTLIDPLLSLLICALILYSSVRLIGEALHVLMEGVPLHLELTEIGSTMAEVKGVRSVHDLHVWTLSSGRVALSAHVVLGDMQGWPALLRALRQLLHDRYRIEHVTLQPECLSQRLYPIKASPADPDTRGAPRPSTGTENPATGKPHGTLPKT